MDKVKNKKILEKQGLILKMEQVRVLFQTPHSKNDCKVLQRII